jgi:uncharacterized protein (DUF1499 family)
VVFYLDYNRRRQLMPLNQEGRTFARMSLWLSVIGVIVFCFAAAAAAFWLVGPERVWTLFGPADLGSVDFETLERRTTNNDALACPTGVCRADTDILPPVYPVDAATLRKTLLQALKTERRLTRVAIDDQLPADRFIQRSEKLRFPDTIVVRYIALPGGTSTVAMYSRSQLGRGDLGVNLARVERWLNKLSREVGRMRPN